MLRVIISVLLLLTFAAGFISEFDREGIDTSTQVKGAAIENIRTHSLSDKTPFDDCAEGTPCHGHCHFGQCLSVILASTPEISPSRIMNGHFSDYGLLATGGFPLTHFRPPII